jgi:hypothetical protein
MAVKRLSVFFEGNSLHIDSEEDDLRKVIKFFVTGKQTGQLGSNSLIYGDNYCICLDKVISMAIGSAGPTPQEEIVRIMKKETEDNEPWKKSLRPDNEEDE